MNRLLKIWLILLTILFIANLAFAVGEPETRKILGLFKKGPRSVITVEYGSEPKGFTVGQFYVLKVLKVRGNKVDYGFCQLNVED